MNCPKCGYDRMKVDRTYRGDCTDERIVRCMCCQAEFIEESKIIGAYKRDPDKFNFYPQKKEQLREMTVHIVQQSLFTNDSTFMGDEQNV